MADPRKDIEDSGKDLTRLFQTQTKSVKELHDLLGQISQGPLTKYTRGMELAKDNLEAITSLNRNLLKTIQDNAKEAAIQQRAAKEGLSTAMAELVIAKEKAILNAQQSGLYDSEVEVLASRYDKAIQYQKQLDKEVEIKEKEKEIAKKISEIEDGRFKALDGINSKMSTLNDILTDQRVAAAMFFSQVNKGYQNVSHMMAEVRKEGFTVGQAFHETGLAMYDAFSLGGTSAKDSLEVMKGMRSEMGSLEKVTSDARREAASLAKTFGISNEEAGKLTAQFAVMPGATMESANNTLEFAGNLAKAAGVAPGEVMKDIANSAEDVASYSKDGGKNIAVAAVAAKKLGVDFSSITKAAEGLLDFESSINKQMEASVLLGREINLDKAREAALNGDLVGATQEMLANVGGEAEFNKMNVMQRKALAESMGVSVQDLAKMVKNQDELTNLTEEQQQALATGELSMDEALANAGGLASKMAESATSIISGVVGFGEMSAGIKSAATEAKSLFGGIMSGIKGMKGGGGIKGGIKGMMGLDKPKELPGADLATKSTEGAAGAADKANKIKPGKGGIAQTFKDVAAGLKAFANGKVVLGAFALIPVAAGLVAMLAGLPALLILSVPGIGAGFKLNAKGIAAGIKALGSPALLAAAFIASLVLAMLGAALIPLTYALSLLSPLIEAFGKVITAVFEGMAVLVGAIADAFVVMFQAFADNWQVLIPVGIGLTALGIGMLALGAASFFAFPGLMLAAAGLALMIPGLSIVNEIAQANALGALGESLTAISAAGPGLALVGFGLMGIAAGLGMMALAGLAALPIIGALTMLAAVAPALSGLMGGGGKGEEDKMQVIADKLDQLIAVASKSGDVNMDGRKVGEIVRLGLNSSNVR